MLSLVWLMAAVVLAIAAYLVAWPAWRSYRVREERDRNAERYRAWRGRARSGPRTSTDEGVTGEERRRLMLGVALAAGSLASLFAFFVTG